MKRFIIKTLLYSLPILMPILVFVCCISPNLSGDIGYLGYVTFPDSYVSKVDLSDSKLIHCEYGRIFPKDNSILTIGDSFSRGKSYNYYLASKTNDSVYYLSKQWQTNPFQRFMYMARTQELPQVVVVECVERVLVQRLSKLNISQSVSSMLQQHIIDTTTVVRKTTPQKDKTVLESTQEWIKRKMNLKGYANPIKSAKLSKPCFSCEGREDELYFYVDDLKNMHLTDASAKIVSTKLDSLFEFAKSKNIDLYILIAADKYDVYQEYIIDNQYPPKTLLKELEQQYQHPNLIISRDTLYDMVQNNILDVFWANDTHWSPVGAEAVAEQILKYID